MSCGFKNLDTLRVGICNFKNLLVFLRFLNLENVLSPEGRFVAYPVGVQLFLVVIYPPKGDT